MGQYLIKVFDNKQWADNFLNYGELLFRHISSFRDTELEDRKDLREGETQEIYNIKVPAGKKKIFFGAPNRNGKIPYLDLEKLEREKGIRLSDNPYVTFRINYCADAFIYSMTLYDDEYRYHNQVLQQLYKFGQHAVIVKDMSAFFQVVRRAIPLIATRRVTYSDTPNGIFEKSHRYELEQEFRLAVGIKIEDNFHKFRIGNLNSVAMYIPTDMLPKLNLS